MAKLKPDKLEAVHRAIQALRVEWQPVEVRVDRDFSRRGHEKGVAVGRRGGGDLRADKAVCARPVLDHERLAEQRPDLLAELAREEIDAAAGRVRHDDADRARWIGVLGKKLPGKKQ